ncbi:hypothetical protein [Lysobacter gummosus]|uniref:hypothetical protein n=1 Tax=Lysobacter gummosus TaxID=262324 RepID=UPI003624AEC2
MVGFLGGRGAWGASAWETTAASCSPRAWADGDGRSDRPLTVGTRTCPRRGRLIDRRMLPNH